MKNRFKVIEGHNAYYLLDTVTNSEVCLGDGVDQANGMAGTEAFRQVWEDEVNSTVEEIFEAYLYDLYSLEIFDSPKFVDRYTVIVKPVSSLYRALRNCEDLCECLCLSHNPDSPQGVSQWGTCALEYMSETQDQIEFLNLPENVQAHIARRLEDD